MKDISIFIHEQKKEMMMMIISYHINVKIKKNYILLLLFLNDNIVVIRTFITFKWCCPWGADTFQSRWCGFELDFSIKANTSISFFSYFRSYYCIFFLSILSYCLFTSCYSILFSHVHIELSLWECLCECDKKVYFKNVNQNR